MNQIKSNRNNLNKRRVMRFSEKLNQLFNETSEEKTECKKENFIEELHQMTETLLSNIQRISIDLKNDQTVTDGIYGTCSVTQ